jgi:CrcB protein
MLTLNSIFLIGIGATIGASIRYLLSIYFLEFLEKGLPYGTLFANVIGSFIAGAVILLVAEKANIGESYRLFLVVGLAGSLTTMSTLSGVTCDMSHLGDVVEAGWNGLVISLA